jgi:hypothetical protein
MALKQQLENSCRKFFKEAGELNVPWIANVWTVDAPNVAYIIPINSNIIGEVQSFRLSKTFVKKRPRREIY